MDLQLNFRPLDSVALLTIPMIISIYDVTGHQGHGRQVPTAHHDNTQDTSGSTGRHSAQKPDKPAGFHDSSVVMDTEHINEHLQGVSKVNASEMSQMELEFHYFKLHDFDNNTKLDGLEIFKALTHLLPYDEISDEHKTQIDTTGKTHDQIDKEKNNAALLYYTDIVDSVLRDDDIDNDGYLTYPEYILARRRDDVHEGHS